MDVNKLKKPILGIIFRYLNPETCVVFLFGSLAQGTIYPSSDIDIGVISANVLDISILVKLRQELSEVKTLRDIDLVDFSGIHDKNFLKIALKEVEIWHQTKKSKVYLSNLKKRISD